jgi:U4/U6 small nuclear ribonucleoprotein PRP31
MAASGDEDNFIKDLEELSDDEKAPIEEGKVEISSVPLKYEQISKLLSSEEYQTHVKAIETSMNYSEQQLRNLNSNDTLYQLLDKSNKLLLEIESEIPVIHKYLRDIYILKFPELESLVPNPVDYAKIVQRIGNESDITNMSFNDILPNNVNMILNVAGADTKGRLLTDNEFLEVQKACNDILALDQARSKILNFMEYNMQQLAPNVCVIVGPTIAAKLVAAAGGLAELAKTPSCNIQVLGSQHKALHGLSSARAGLHRGFIADADLVKIAPEGLQMRMIKMIAGKTAIAARTDMCGTATYGEEGKKLKTQIVETFKKIQEPKVSNLKRPLPRPEDKPKKRRAGKRLTGFRRRVQMTEFRKLENRMTFGPDAQEEYRDTGKTFGMLGVKGTGKLKVNAKKDQKILRKYDDKNDKRCIKGATGLTSSLVFAQDEGIKLYNPEYLANQIKEQQEVYFGDKAGFSTVTNMRKGGPSHNVIF